MNGSSKVEMALKCVKDEIHTDETGVDTCAHDLAAEVLRLRSELSSERGVREQFARDAVGLRAALKVAREESMLLTAALEHKNPRGLENLAKALGSPEAEELRHWADRAKAAEADSLENVRKAKENWDRAEAAEAKLSKYESQGYPQMSKALDLANSKLAEAEKRVLEAQDTEAMWTRAVQAESRCAASAGREEAQREIIKGLESRLSAYTAPVGEKELEELLGVADSSANWKRAHPIACNEALVSLARALRQSRAALLDTQTKGTELAMEKQKEIFTLRKKLDSALAELAATKVCLAGADTDKSGLIKELMKKLKAACERDTRNIEISAENAKYRDEYQRLWHTQAAEAKTLASRLASAERVVEAARPLPGFEGKAAEHGRLLTILRRTIADHDAAKEAK